MVCFNNLLYTINMVFLHLLEYDCIDKIKKVFFENL